MDRVDTFIEAYKRLEESVRRVYRLTKEQSVIGELKRQPRFEPYKAEIQSCADLRNFLQHNARLDGCYAAEPSDKSIAFVQELTAMVNNRKRCRDICVLKKDLVWRRPDDPVKPAMEQMQVLGHSSIPILSDGRVVGIFDERSFFRYVSRCTGEIFPRERELVFRDLAFCTSLSAKHMQVYAFASMNAYADEVIDLFEQKLEDGKRVRLVLLTASGRPDDRLRGILTPWDLIAAN